MTSIKSIAVSLLVLLVASAEIVAQDGQLVPEVCPQPTSCEYCVNSMGVEPWGPNASSDYYRSVIPGRLWIAADYLGWSTKGVRLPALITTSPAGTALADAGVLGLPTTTVAFGDQDAFDSLRSGGKITIGWWSDREHTSGIEGSYLRVGGDDSSLYQAGDGTNIVARPFFNVDTNMQDSRLVAFPTTAVGITNETRSGAVFANAATDFSMGELIHRDLIGCSDNHRIEIVSGYRYGWLRDQILISETIDTVVDTPGVSVVETTGTLYDSITARNQFHGSELGFLANRWWGRFSLQFLSKVALGASVREITYSGRTVGQTTTTPAVGVATVATFDDPAGLLVQNSNTGKYQSTNFAVLAEVGTSVDYIITRDLKLSVGYNYIGWSNVSRAAGNIDLGIDPTQTQARPAVSLSDTGFWAQGIRLGVTYLF